MGKGRSVAVLREVPMGESVEVLVLAEGLGAAIAAGWKNRESLRITTTTKCVRAPALYDLAASLKKSVE